MNGQFMMGRVVVLTGAASGIGRETAVLLSQRGARLVLADNDIKTLKDLAEEIDALAVPCDVASYVQVCKVAELAAQRYGGIDVWINNAGVAAYGTVEQTDMADIARVIDVNLMGTVHGVKAALPYLSRTGGVLINVSSILGERAVPLQAAYCAAKHAVVGFSEALRMELRHARVPVRVVDVRPSGINTPLFEHARSRIGAHPKPTPPVYEPAVVARTIAAVAQRPVRDVVVGGAGRVLEWAQRISPALVDWAMLSRGGLFDTQRTDQPDNGRDNLYRPIPGPGRSAGLFGRRSHAGSAYTALFGLHPGVGRLGVALALGAAVAAAAHVRGRSS